MERIRIIVDRETEYRIQESEVRSQEESGIQEPESRIQNDKAENRFHRFSFILTSAVLFFWLLDSGFWLLTPGFCLLTSGSGILHGELLV
jgi:hypothetical protein